MFKEHGVRKASRHFLVARFARLYPLYFVGLVLSVSFVAAPPFLQSAWVALSCLTLTQTWFNVPGASEDIIGGSWSISTEAFLYFLFIPTAAWVAKAQHAKRWLIVLCIASPFVILWMSKNHGVFDGYLEFFHINSRTSFNSTNSLLFVTYYSPITRAFEFFTGVFAAKLVMENVPLLRQRFVKTAMTLCLLWPLAVMAFAPQRGFLVENLLPNFIYAPAIAVILILLCQHETKFGKFLSSRTMVVSGDISYSVYLMQSLVFVTLHNSFVHWHGLGDVLRIIYTIAIVTIFAYGSYHLFEMPMRKLIRNRFSRQIAV